LKVADYISDYLTKKEMSHVFGMSGANIEDLFSAIHQNKNKNKDKSPTIILAKNEYNAATMAIGSYLATQKVSVVLTTSGPGVLNTLPVLAEAFSSRIPLILISGLVPSQLEGHGAFQDLSGKGGTLDIMEMTKHCSCFQKKIQDPNEIPKALEQAFVRATTQKKPAVLLIPKDLFNQSITDFGLERTRPIPKKTCPLELINAISFCRQFSRGEHSPPLLVLGEELIHLPDLFHIRDFIKKTNAAVALTPSSKGLFDHKNPQFLGLIGIMGHEQVNDYLKHTEHVIFIGSNLDLLNRQGLESSLRSKHILLIKEEKSPGFFRPNGKSLCEIYGELEENFAKLAEVVSTRPRLPTPQPLSSSGVNGLTGLLDYSFKNIIHEIQTAIETDANIFVDAGNSGAFVIHHLEPRGKGICYVSLGMGGMGHSIGAGIGSSAASGKKSYIFLGDGSFLMHGLEIHTALEYSLPVNFFIFNNNSHGMCSTRENVFLGGETGMNNFRVSRFAEGIAKIFPGISAYDVDDLSQLKSALENIKPQKGPCLLSINIANSEDPPFKTFIKKTHEVQNESNANSRRG